MGGRSTSSSRHKNKERKHKHSNSSSATDGKKKDKKHSSKYDKKRRSHSRKSHKRSKRKKGKSRSRSGKKKNKSRSRSKRKLDRSKSRKGDKDRRKEKRSHSPSDSNAKKGQTFREKMRLGGFDARSSLPNTIPPTTALVARTAGGEMVSTSTTVPMMPPFQVNQEPSAEVEAFLLMNPVEANAAARMRNLPPHMARHVIQRGSLLGARDTAAVLNSRIRDAIQASQTPASIMPTPHSGSSSGHSGHAGIESLISRFNIDAQCAQMLRALPPHLQAMAAELPVQEARNASAFVMAQLQSPRFRQGTAPANGPQMFQVV